MNISWFEIIAQIVNFFIILFILQKLLYKPVMKAMAQRQERIQKAQKEADAKMKEAETLVAAYDKKTEEIESERKTILETARTEAREKKESLLADYQKEAESKRQLYLKEIEDEKESFLRHLRKNLGESAVKIASRILSALSSKELEAEVFETFLADLKALSKSVPDPEELKKEERVQVHSFRELTKSEQKAIRDALKEQLPNVGEIEFETESELMLGHALYLETYTVHTNIKNYLDEIEKEIAQRLDVN